MVLMEIRGEHTYAEAAKRQEALFTPGMKDHDRSILIDAFARDFLPPTGGCFHTDGLATVRNQGVVIGSNDPRYEGPPTLNAAGEPAVMGFDTGARVLRIDCRCGASAKYTKEPTDAQNRATERWLATGLR